MVITDLVLTRDARISKILKPTKARMFKDCRVGDILHFSIEFRSVGRGSRGTYAAYVKVHNTRTSKETEISFNNAYMYSDLIELEEV